MSTDTVNLRNSCQQRATSAFRDFERGYCTAGSGVVPGWFTLDEITQSKPKASLMCTGTYTDEGVSFTAIQWAWVEKLDSSTFVTMSATATTTTHSFPKYFDEISRMVKKVSVA